MAIQQQPWLLSHSLASPLLCWKDRHWSSTHYSCFKILSLCILLGWLSKRITTWRASLSSIGPVCAAHGLCHWISIVDASVGEVSTENNVGGQTQKEMRVNTQDPSQVQKHHRGSWWQFSCFCQKQISTWSFAAQHKTIKPIEMLPFTSIYNRTEDIDGATHGNVNNASFQGHFNKAEISMSPRWVAISLTSG